MCDRFSLLDAIFTFQQLTQTSNGNMLDFFDPVGKFVDLDLYETSLGQRFPNPLSPGFLTHRRAPSGLGVNTPFRSAATSRFLLGSMEPEIDIRQVLVQLRPKRLLPVAGIDPAFGHGNEPLFPSLSLVL